MKRRDRPNRQLHPRNRKQRFLIVCEGKVTEREYFDHARLTHRHVILEISSGGEPGVLVKRAIRKKIESDRKALGDVNEGYDQVWCVCDVDRHTKLPGALQQARGREIKMAVSNPCFELWALLHFQDRNAFIESGNLKELCKRHMPEYEKSLPCEKLEPLYPNALKRAKELDSRHLRNGTEGENPSTGVHKLMEEIRLPSTGRAV